MAVSLFVLGATLAVALILLKTFQSFQNAGRKPLPPGPKGLPLIGNLNDMPPPGVLEAHHWLKHKELYGGFLFAMCFQYDVSLSLVM